ncbi:diaminopimelate epimerase [Rubrivirga sp. IMCC43871]|uniref:diaminopimelate epimerase n=1 Tax=Rubrivirga sp. IMCC43871 TaxID=3391575 RepID=UPI00398FD4B9
MLDRPALIVPFTKMNGAGNDFVVVDNRFMHFSDGELAAFARRLCPRRTGVGADGLLALAEGGEGFDFRMRYRNADGSLGTMCGNGARCLARFAARAGLGRGEVTVELAFETDGGPYRATVEGRAASGPVSLNVPAHRDVALASIEADPACGVEPAVLGIWTGTEHAVVFTADVDAADVATEGARLRNAPAFAPTGTNVDFVEVTGADRIRVRTFEKGVEAETLACGTGAIASALAAHLDGRLAGDGPRSVAVEMPGGTLTVGFVADGDSVTDLTLAGPAETVYEGTVEWRG